MRYLSLLTLLFALACDRGEPDASIPPPPPPPLTATTTVSLAPVPVPLPITPIIQASFSPGCTDLVVRFIQSARTQVHLLAYSFTSDPISAALIEAKHRGRDVIVVLDKSDLKNPKALALKAAGIPVFIDTRHAIMHNKYIVVDGSKLETGSFNYTFSAERRNAENCLQIADAPGIVDSYEREFNIHKGHASLLH